MSYFPESTNSADRTWDNEDRKRGRQTQPAPAASGAASGAAGEEARESSEVGELKRDFQGLSLDVCDDGLQVVLLRAGDAQGFALD